MLAHGDHATLSTVKKLYREAELQEEKIRLLTSMGSVKEAKLIKDVLSFSLSVSMQLKSCSSSVADQQTIHKPVLVINSTQHSK